MYDPTLSIAELRKGEILTRHHVRQILEHGDEATAREFLDGLLRQATEVRNAIRKIREPRMWVIYCIRCDYQEKPNTFVHVLICPHCRGRLERWDLAVGERPRRYIKRKYVQT